MKRPVTTISEKYILPIFIFLMVAAIMTGMFQSVMYLMKVENLRFETLNKECQKIGYDEYSNHECLTRDKNNSPGEIVSFQRIKYECSDKIENDSISCDIFYGGDE